VGVEIGVSFGGLLSSLASFGKRVDDEVLRALDEGAALVANDAKAGHPKIGDISTRGLSYAGMGASGARAFARTAAEDAYRVANVDGSLRWLTRTDVTRNSIIPIRAKKTDKGLEAHVVSGQAHSTDLEYGTVTRRPFPFMRPALAKNQTEIRRRVEAAVRRGIEGV
jgi:HK97 gp10 family phage protein